MTKTDEELIVSAREGEMSAFRELVERYQRMVFNIIYHYMGRSDDVEDLAQEVFLKVYRSLDRFDTSRPFKHWVGRITANQCLDELRKRKIRRTELISDLSAEQNSKLEHIYQEWKGGGGLNRQQVQQWLGVLEDAMDRLSDKDRMAFVMREMEDMEYSEVASMLQSTELAARIRVSRARKALKKELEKILNAQ